MRSLAATASAWGAGLVQAALGAGAVVAEGAPPLARGIGVALVVVGLLAFGWGAVCLATGRPVVARLVPAGALLGILLVAALLLVFPARTSVLAVAVALLLLLVAAVIAARASRATDTPPHPTRLWAFAVVVALMTSVTVPALSSVQDALLMDADGRVPVIPGHAGH